MTGETATLGDFGAGGPRSDAQIDKQAAAKEAAAGDWELLAAGTNTVGWHIPSTRCTILLKARGFSSAACTVNVSEIAV